MPGFSYCEPTGVAEQYPVVTGYLSTAPLEISLHSNSGHHRAGGAPTSPFYGSSIYGKY